MNDGLDVGDRLNRAVGRDDKKYDGNSSMQHRGAEKSRLVVAMVIVDYDSCFVVCCVT